jgi:hypothetical protein
MNVEAEILQTDPSSIAVANIINQSNNFCGGGLGGSSHYTQLAYKAVQCERK